jgi:glucose/arabinose dehydrogenase
LLAAGSASAQTQGIIQVAAGFSSPIDVRSAPGDPSTLYVVQQPGTIVKVLDGKVAGTFFDITAKVKSGGEQGLLSMAFSPGYATNHLFYVSYTDLDGNSRVVQYRSANGVGVPSSARQLLFVHQPYSNHNGGDLQFDPHGYLYFGLGDGGSEDDPQQTSQNMSSRLGKLLRIDPLKKGAIWHVVALGLRNPWRYSFDAAGDLWIGDVGQDTWEEVDFRPAAKVGVLANYGWSRYEGKAVYSSQHGLAHVGQLVFPTFVYHHGPGCSITGGYVFGGRYYYGDYCSGQVFSFGAGPKGRTSAPRLEGVVPSVSSFGIGPDGALYAVSLQGTLFKIS